MTKSPRAQFGLIGVVTLLVAGTCACASVPSQNEPIACLDPDAAPPVAAAETARASPAARQSGYFPPTALDPLLDAYFARELVAMNEPSLRDYRGTRSTAYRFLWIRSFDDPIAVRAEEHAGRATLIVKRLHSEGGRGERLDLDRERPLTRREWARVESDLAAAHLADTPSTRDDNGFDGSEWMLEGVRDDRQHVVRRWSPDRPEDAAFRSACLTLLWLAGSDVDRGYVY